MSDRIPILRMGDCLLLSIQVDLHDQLAVQLQDDLTASIQRYSSRGVLIEISAVEIVDSFIGRMLTIIGSMSRLFDAETVLVGMRPAVAIPLTELGLTLDHGPSHRRPEKGVVDGCLRVRPQILDLVAQAGEVLGQNLLQAVPGVVGPDRNAHVGSIPTAPCHPGAGPGRPGRPPVRSAP